MVGRLVGWEGDELRVRSRDGSLTRIDAAAVLASRLVPEHPRLPPEPSG